MAGRRPAQQYDKVVTAKDNAASLQFKDIWITAKTLFMAQQLNSSLLLRRDNCSQAAIATKEV